MPLPKRPSGGAVPQNVALPELGEPQNKAAAEPEQDFALPELDDFTLPDLDTEPEPAPPVRLPKTSSIPKTAPIKTAAPDVSRNQFNSPASNNQDVQQPSETAVSDDLDTYEDEDEETALNRELGLLDDDYIPVKKARPEAVVESLPTVEELSPVESGIEESDENDDLLAALEESLQEENDSDDEFADLLKGLEDIAGDSSDDTPEEANETPAASDSGDDEWELALSELESFNADSSSENAEEDQDDSEEDDDEDEDEESWEIETLEEFTPPANPFEIPKDLEDVADPEDEDDSEEDALPLPEDDFVPPSDPFANPFPDEEAATDDEEIEEKGNKSSNGSSLKDKLKDKVALLLSPERAKQGFADYTARLKAEMNGEDAPAPKPKSKKAPIEDQESERQEEDDFNGQGDDNRSGGRGGRGRSPLAIFGFLSPIRSLYMALVNILFGIITAILGILSKLPLIGFVFKIALEATKVLRTIAQYLPLAFLIATLATVSYLSVPRESVIALPDSGGATFNEFKYDAGSNSVTGVIVNTGDIIADVQPEFTIKSIQPTLNPMTWFMPEVASTCVATPVQVDIDATINVTAECGEPVSGFIPRATGELK